MSRRRPIFIQGSRLVSSHAKTNQYSPGAPSVSAKGSIEHARKEDSCEKEPSHLRRGCEASGHAIFVRRRSLHLPKAFRLSWREGEGHGCRAATAPRSDPALGSQHFIRSLGATLQRSVMTRRSAFSPELSWNASGRFSKATRRGGLHHDADSASTPTVIRKVSAIRNFHSSPLPSAVRRKTIAETCHLQIFRQPIGCAHSSAFSSASSGP